MLVAVPRLGVLRLNSDRPFRGCLHDTRRSLYPARWRVAASNHSLGIDLAAWHPIRWPMGTRRDATFVIDALHMAVATRGHCNMSGTTFRRPQLGELLSSAAHLFLREGVIIPPQTIPIHRLSYRHPVASIDNVDDFVSGCLLMGCS